MTFYLHITAWLRSLTPKCRRTMAKRRLETILREHGIPQRAAMRITWQFFNPSKGNQ